MQSSELWAAWIVAALLVGTVAWVGHIEPRYGGGLTPASDVARRAPVTNTRSPGEIDEPTIRRDGPLMPVLQRLGPSSDRLARVYVCVIDGPRQGVC